jgi:hypothetical protein
MPDPVAIAAVPKSQDETSQFDAENKSSSYASQDHSISITVDDRPKPKPLTEFEIAQQKLNTSQYTQRIFKNQTLSHCMREYRGPLKQFQPIALPHSSSKNKQLQSNEQQQQSNDNNGQCIFLDNSKYNGEFKLGLMHGQGELHHSNDASIYKGKFEHHQITGQGEFIWSSSDDQNNNQQQKQQQTQYKGQLLNGYRHGQGRYSDSQRNCTYAGEWLHGARHGTGTLYYDAYFNNDESLPLPTDRLHNRQTGMTVYNGEWSQGCRSGIGTMYYGKTGSIYNGEWKNDMKNGFGHMKWCCPIKSIIQNNNNDTSLSSKYNHELKQIYIGQWSNDKMNGYGEFIWLLDTSFQVNINTLLAMQQQQQQFTQQQNTKISKHTRRASTARDQSKSPTMGQHSSNTTQRRSIYSSHGNNTSSGTAHGTRPQLTIGISKNNNNNTSSQPTSPLSPNQQQQYTTTQLSF